MKIGLLPTGPLVPKGIFQESQILKTEKGVQSHLVQRPLVFHQNQQKEENRVSVTAPVFQAQKRIEGMKVASALVLKEGVTTKERKGEINPIFLSQELLSGVPAKGMNGGPVQDLQVQAKTKKAEDLTGLSFQNPERKNEADPRIPQGMELKEAQNLVVKPDWENRPLLRQETPDTKRKPEVQEHHRIMTGEK